MWRIDVAAVLGAALWLLHPLFVSTTLYIVQREAMLPATFTLIGLLLWLHGRGRLLRGRTVSGLAWMVLGLGGCTVLGVLSKANGILLPALALVVEYTALRHGCPTADAGTAVVGAAEAATATPPASPISDTASRNPIAASAAATAAGSLDGEGAVAASAAPTAVGSLDGDGAVAASAAPTGGVGVYRWAMGVLAWLPAAVVAGYLLMRGWNGIVHGISSTRPWTLGQRLLTEPRVLMDYLQLLWLPRPFTPGLFNDQIVASTSLWSPWTTLPCLLAVLGLIVGACLLRRRFPALAMAVLFYFVGQSLESSTVALELYFEHRNYLPAMVMFWPLALWLCGVRQGIEARTGGRAGAHGSWGLARVVLAVALLAGLGAMTHARASLWGDTHDQALLWARLNPQSPRAQANAAMAEIRAGRPARAAVSLRALLAKQPDQVQLALNLLAAECSMGAVRPSTLESSKTALATTRNPGALLIHWFGRAIEQAAHPACPQMGMHTVESLLDAAQSNPRLMAIRGRRQDLAYLRGRIALKRGKPDAALADFNHALDQDVRATAAFKQAALLGSLGYPRRGLAHLDHYEAQAGRHPAHPGFGMPRIHAWVLHHQHYWQNELVRLRATLRADAAAKAK